MIYLRYGLELSKWFCEILSSIVMEVNKTLFSEEPNQHQQSNSKNNKH